MNEFKFNEKGKDTPEIFGISHARADELTELMLDISRRHRELAAKQISEAYENGQIGIELDVAGLIVDHLALATTAQEGAFCSYCAGISRVDMEEFHEHEAKRVTLLGALKKHASTL